MISHCHCVQPECPQEAGEMAANGLDSLFRRRDVKLKKGYGERES